MIDWLRELGRRHCPSDAFFGKAGRIDEDFVTFDKWNR